MPHKIRAPKEAPGFFETTARKAVALTTGTTMAVNLAEGRYEAFSNIINSRLEGISRDIKVISRTLNGLDLGLDAKALVNKLEEIQERIEGNNYDSIEEISKRLSFSGKIYAKSIEAPDQNERIKREKSFLEDANKSSSIIEKETKIFDDLLQTCVSYQRAIHKGTKFISTQTPGITMPPDYYLAELKSKISRMVAKSSETSSYSDSDKGLRTMGRTEPVFNTNTKESENSNQDKTIQGKSFLDRIEEDLTDAVVAREQLNMMRMARLRLSFPVGNQIGEASKIVREYSVNYKKEHNTKQNTLNKLGELVKKGEFEKAAELAISENLRREDIAGLGRKFNAAFADMYEKMNLEENNEELSQTASEKKMSKSQFFEKEAEEVEKTIKEAQKYLRIHRKLDKKTIKTINSQNVRFISLYRIAQDSMNEEENNRIIEKIEMINNEIEKLSTTATSFGQKLKVKKSEALENEKLDSIKAVFNASTDSTDFSLVLMNSLNQKDVFQYMRFMDKQHVFIGEFLLSLMELKSLPNSNSSDGSDPDPGKRMDKETSNVHYLKTRDNEGPMPSDTPPPAAAERTQTGQSISGSSTQEARAQQPFIIEEDE